MWKSLIPFQFNERSQLPLFLKWRIYTCEMEVVFFFVVVSPFELKAFHTFRMLKNLCARP